MVSPPSDAAETAHPEHEDTQMEIHGNDVVRQMEVEEMERKGDEDTSKVRRLTWVNPYEGKHEPKKFSGGPSDKTVLLEYRSTPHIARCVYNGFAWIYDHFEDTSGSLNDEFLLDNPRATKYESTNGLASICDILNGLMINDEVPNGSHIYKELESACTLTFVPNQGGPGSSSQR
ncbi:hypothetical protein TSUD_147170 [Trifolium subterraneum]|uniref:Uncharacterized protein n=1 Tax=Trifolium subterraneum TaxID=3900 RepID=A0A2Z6MQS5_TRISU|nr:hypothetical protein TSUD_147170 [Trifolium subterraneum]